MSRACNWPPPPTNNEVMLYRYQKREHNCERNRRIPPLSPPVFCTEAKFAKVWGGAGVFAGHYGNYSKTGNENLYMFIDYQA